MDVNNVLCAAGNKLLCFYIHQRQSSDGCFDSYFCLKSQKQSV